MSTKSKKKVADATPKLTILPETIPFTPVPREFELGVGNPVQMVLQLEGCAVVSKPTAINFANERVVIEQEPTVQDSEDDKKKRRGRKPKDKFAFDDVCQDKPDALTEQDNNMVIKIPINCMELNKEFNLADTYSITCPKPFEKPLTDSTYKYLYDAEQNENMNTLHGDLPYPNCQTSSYVDFYQGKAHDLLTDIIEPNNKKQLTQVEILLEKKYKHTKQVSLLTSMCLSHNNEKWIEKTNLACFWDCHNFDHQPWGIPTKYNYLTGQFTMYGVFCSPNCAMSHLLTYETNTNTLWERVSLLNLLYYKIYETDENIIPAPDKICLKLFGGPLDISEFRALTIKNNKIYNINFPPCNIITPVLEETKKVFNQDSYFIPNDKKKQNKIQTELKIKRSRSVTANKNTLDSLILAN